MEIPLFPKEHDIYILTLNETWLNIPNYIITRNDRPRSKREGVAILVRENVNFGTADTYSSTDSDNEAITIILKDSQISTTITF